MDLSQPGALTLSRRVIGETKMKRDFVGMESSYLMGIVVSVGDVMLPEHVLTCAWMW